MDNGSQSALRCGTVGVAVALRYHAEAVELHVQGGVAIERQVFQLVGGDHLAGRGFDRFEGRGIAVIVTESVVAPTESVTFCDYARIGADNDAALRVLLEAFHFGGQLVSAGQQTAGRYRGHRYC